MPMKPVKMTSADLAQLLSSMANSVSLHDSFEGSIEYSCLSEECGRGEFMVSGAYRIGNREGQGGMRLIGEV